MLRLGGGVVVVARAVAVEGHGERVFAIDAASHDGLSCALSFRAVAAFDVLLLGTIAGDVNLRLPVVDVCVRLLVGGGESRHGEAAALGGVDLLVVYARSLDVADDVHGDESRALEGSRMPQGVLVAFVLEGFRALTFLGDVRTLEGGRMVDGDSKGLVDGVSVSVVELLAVLRPARSLMPMLGLAPNRGEPL